MKILVTKDSHGFLARVEGQDNIFAHGETQSDAKKELLNVIEMMMDYHLEQIETERKIKNTLLAG